MAKMIGRLGIRRHNDLVGPGTNGNTPVVTAGRHQFRKTLSPGFISQITSINPTISVRKKHKTPAFPLRENQSCK